MYAVSNYPHIPQGHLPGSNPGRGHSCRLKRRGVPASCSRVPCSPGLAGSVNTSSRARLSRCSVSFLHKFRLLIQFPLWRFWASPAVLLSALCAGRLLRVVFHHASQHARRRWAGPVRRRRLVLPEADSARAAQRRVGGEYLASSLAAESCSLSGSRCDSSTPDAG